MSSGQPTVDVPGNANALAGSLLMAAYANWALLGVLAVQVYLYYLAFPRDSRLPKILVYGIFLWELAQTVLVSADIYASLANTFGDAQALDSIRGFWFSLPVSGGVTGSVGQIFFAYRIYAISKHRGAPTIITILAVASVCASLAAAQALSTAGTFSHLNNHLTDTLTTIGVWNGLGALCDIVIALVMPYFLMRHGTGLRETHIMIVKLVRLIIETGFLTAVVAILHLCLYFANNESFLVPGLVVSKFYANTMLAMMNNRMKIENGRFSSRKDSGVNSDQIEFKNADAVRSRTRIIVDRDRLTIRLDDLDNRMSERKPSADAQSNTSPRSPITPHSPLAIVPSVPYSGGPSEMDLSRMSHESKLEFDSKAFMAV